MTNGILPNASLEIFRVLRVCFECNLVFALERVGTDESSKQPVYRCKHCGKEATLPEPRPPRCL